MNEYIIFTTEGYTEAPNNNVEVNNCQLLGRTKGKNKEEAINNLLIENAWISECGFSKESFIVEQIVTKEMSADIQKVVEYLWDDEERHYQECGNYPKNHIFRVLKRLKKS